MNIKRKILSVVSSLVLLLSVFAGAVPASASQVNIYDLSVSEVTSSGYRVTVSFGSAAGVSKVLLPTWTDANGQDDLVWHQAEVSGNTATAYIETSAHGGQSGQYITHCYIYDNNGQYAVAGTDTQVPASSSSQPLGTLEVGSVDVSGLTSSGYTVTASVNAPNGIAKVLMATWTAENGQDDLTWNQAAVNGNTAVFTVSTSDHKQETGTYYTHVYLYDNYGKYAVNGTKVIVPAASSQGETSAAAIAVSDVAVSELTNGGYRITATLQVPAAGIAKVLMPTWTEANGQDDLVWHQATVSGSTASCYISASDHAGQSGNYFTHVYAYANDGTYAVNGTEIEVPAASGGSSSSDTNAEVAINSVTVSEVSSSGYRVTAEFTAPSCGIAKVIMPTWTEADGQDDLVWNTAEVSGNTATCYISASEHSGQTGIYLTHTYVYANDGTFALAGKEISVPASSSGDTTGGGTTGGDTTEGGTTGGDTTGGGTAGGTSAGSPAVGTVAVSELTSSGFRITAQISAPNGVSRVLVASWTETNGQDDLQWQTATVSGNLATVYVSASDHGSQSGVYNVHVYLYDSLELYAVGSTQVTVSASTEINRGTNTGVLAVSIPYVLSKDATGYTVRATFSAPSGLRRMAAGVIFGGITKWYDMTVSGIYGIVRIPTSDFGYGQGIYQTTIFVWDYAGGQVKVDTQVPIP